MTTNAINEKEKEERKEEYTNQNDSNNYLSLHCKIIIKAEDLIKILPRVCNHGLCGGRNLGNTCYMNSSIACLSNCYELTYYFLSKKYLKDVNKKNAQGTYGKLPNEWYDLLVDYWTTRDHTGDPSGLKSVISKKVRTFYGYGQQDSNEFMTYFLDLMNEDLNRASKKPYQEIDEQKDGESDDECALRFWTYNYQRNDSIITDLFTGLFKCTVKCPQCSWVSITYEPFNILQLPIPKEKHIFSQNINLFFVPKYGLYQTMRNKLFLKDINITFDKITEEIKKLDNFPFKINNLFYYNVTDNLYTYDFKDNDNYKKMKKNFVFCCENDIECNEDIKNEDIYKVPLYFFKNKDDISAYPRILFIHKKMNINDFIKKLYFFVRRFIKTPIIDEELNKKIEESFKSYEKINDLIELLNKEFNNIFLNEEPSEEITKFKKNLPFKFTLRKDEKNSINLISLIKKQKKEEKEKENEEIKVKENEEEKEKEDIKEEEKEKEDIKENEEEKEKEKKEETETENEINVEKIIEYITKQNYYLNIMIKTDNPYSLEKISLNSCTIIDNSMDIDNDSSSFTLFECFEYFKDKETLKKGNEWFCKKCKQHHCAEKQMEFYYLPKLFVVCLKRFSQGRSYWGGLSKNSEFIDFPLDNMDMKEFVCGPDKNHSIYDCFAVSQHYGSLGGGHYTAICKNIDNNWYSYNDSSCSETSKKQAISDAAYVIFYRRKTD